MENTFTNSASSFTARILLLCTVVFLFSSRSLASPAMMQSIPQNITFSGLNDSLGLNGQNAVREYYFDFSYLPVHKVVQDVDVRINLTHTWTGDVHMFLVSPSGEEIPFFEVQGCLSLFPINTIFDDEGMASGLCADLETLERVQPLNLPGIPGSYLSTFDGLNASGIWTLRIEDQDLAADGGVIFEVGLEILIDLPIMDGSILAHRELAKNINGDKLNGTILEKRSVNSNPEFILFQNEPNPFHGTTVIRYDLPAPQNITLTVFDITGKEILTRQQESTKGQNFLIIQAGDIISTGVLYYRLETNGFSTTKKMLRVD